MVIMKYQTNDHAQRQFVYFIAEICCKALKKLFKSVSVRKSNLKFCTVASIKDSHEITKKSNICYCDFKAAARLTRTLKEIGIFHVKKIKK